MWWNTANEVSYTLQAIALTGRLMETVHIRTLTDLC